MVEDGEKDPFREISFVHLKYQILVSNVCLRERRSSHGTHDLNTVFDVIDGWHMSCYEKVGE